jgi:hypothetical protein
MTTLADFARALATIGRVLAVNEPESSRRSCRAPRPGMPLRNVNGADTVTRRRAGSYVSAFDRFGALTVDVRKRVAFVTGVRKNGEDSGAPWNLDRLVDYARPQASFTRVLNTIC